MGSTGEAAEWPALGLTVTEPQTLSSFTLVPVLFTGTPLVLGLPCRNKGSAHDPLFPS